jgi:hypothetical protein
MPEAMHRALAASANKKGLKGARKDAYVFGTMAKLEKKKKKKRWTNSDIEQSYTKNQ